jgi:hypothetical protein
MENNIILTPVPLETLLQSFRAIIKEEIKAEQLDQLQDKLLSPAEACKIFQPNISKVTLAKWTADGLIPDHRLGGRVFYKYSELIESLKTLKKYKRPAAN